QRHLLSPIDPPDPSAQRLTSPHPCPTRIGRVTVWRGCTRMEWLFAQPLDSIASTRILIILIATAAASAALSALGAFTVGGGKYAAVGSGSVPLAFLAGFVLFLGPPEI